VGFKPLGEPKARDQTQSHDDELADALCHSTKDNEIGKQWQRAGLIQDRITSPGSGAP
jgi:hypothetical protein